MMKKNGFTLAEVLITLAIIGVVATMTLPALMTNTAEQQAKTGLKKAINTLTEAAQMNQAVAGFDYASVNESSPTTAAGFTDENAQKQSLFGLLANRTNIDYRQVDNITSKYDHDMTIYFNDGTALLFDSKDAVANDTNAALQPDGLPLGITVVFDTNGAKGPNILSNCQGTALGVSEDKDENFKLEPGKVLDTSACDDKSKRVIKDQFTLRLRGGYAQPSGEAATWAFVEKSTKATAAEE